MNGGTGNFLLEKAEAFALRIVRLYQHLSEKGELNIPPFILHRSYFILLKMVTYTAKG